MASQPKNEEEQSGQALGTYPVDNINMLPPDGADLADVRDPVEYARLTDEAKDLFRKRQDLIEKGVPEDHIMEPYYPYNPGPDIELPPLTGTIDVAAFVKAQAAFLRIQTAFLRGPKECPDIKNYSLAQGDFIAAQAEVLRQVGVI